MISVRLITDPAVSVLGLALTSTPPSLEDVNVSYPRSLQMLPAFLKHPAQLFARPSQLIEKACRPSGAYVLLAKVQPALAAHTAATTMSFLSMDLSLKNR
jgi:hypothetical protein